VLKMMKDEGFGFMYKTSIEGKHLHFVGYIFFDDTDNIQSGQPGSLSKYWPRACKPILTHGKAYYGLQEEHWSQKSHVGTLFGSSGRMDSGPMFQTRTHPYQYKFIIMQAIEWNLNVWRLQKLGRH
jgi:hypothetical protein